MQNRFTGALLAMMLMMVSAFARAALPAEATTAFNTLSGNVTDMFSAVWPIVAIATGGWALIKLFKKGAGKAV